MLPDTRIKFLKGVGEKRAEQFHALGVSTIDALLRFILVPMRTGAAP